MKHVVIDIETLADVPDAVVLEMAMIIWDTEKAGEVELHYERAPDTREQLEQWGRVTTPSTLEWWEVNPAILKAIENTETTDNGFLGALRQLFNEEKEHKNVRWYCHSKPFDFNILRSFFGEELFNHWQYRDLREYTDLFQFGEAQPWKGGMLSLPIVSGPICDNFSCEFDVNQAGVQHSLEMHRVNNDAAVKIWTDGIELEHLQHHRAVGDVIKEFAELQLWLSIAKRKTGGAE